MQNKLNFALLKKLTIFRVAAWESFLKSNWTCITEGKIPPISELGEIHFNEIRWDMYSVTSEDKEILQQLAYNFKNTLKYFKNAQ